MGTNLPRVWYIGHFIAHGDFVIIQIPCVITANRDHYQYSDVVLFNVDYWSAKGWKEIPKYVQVCVIIFYQWPQHSKWEEMVYHVINCWAFICLIWVIGNETDNCMLSTGTSQLGRSINGGILIFSRYTFNVAVPVKTMKREFVMVGYKKICNNVLIS